jgi:serine/threonine-protein kinase HipA
MRSAKILVNNEPAGILTELSEGKYQFTYFDEYVGSPVSLTLPIKQKTFLFNQFPPFFEGLLPEGSQLEALLRKYKLDRKDLFAQLIQVGRDLIGTTTVEAMK